MTAKELKAKQRKQGIDARKSLSAELAKEYNKLICQKLLSSDVYKNSRTILSYQAFGGEVELTLFNQTAGKDGKRIAFPISEPNGVLIAAIPPGDSSWEVGKYGIRVPIKEKSLLITPEEIDLVIVPCTAFSAEKLMRIGMGAGYYDRFLPQCSNAASVAVAFEAQRAEDLWVDSWDAALDGVVTEVGWYGKI